MVFVEGIGAEPEDGGGREVEVEMVVGNGEESH